MNETATGERTAGGDCCGRPRHRPQPFAPGNSSESGRPLVFAPCLVRVLRQIVQQLEEGRRLTDEESHVRQEVDDAHGSSFGFGGTNHGAWREFATEEWARLRHDQVGLEGLAAEWR